MSKKPERRVFSTGAVRDASPGKGRMDLLPWRAIMEVSRHCEAGALKYGERNVDKGIPLHSLIDSGLRHASKWWIGEADEPHLVAACWNLLWALEMSLTRPDLDDRPIKPSPGGEGGAKRRMRCQPPESEPGSAPDEVSRKSKPKPPKKNPPAKPKPSEEKENFVGTGAQVKRAVHEALTARRDAGQSLAQIAERCGVSAAQIADMLGAKKLPFSVWMITFNALKAEEATDGEAQ